MKLSLLLFLINWNIAFLYFVSICYSQGPSVETNDIEREICINTTINVFNGTECVKKSICIPVIIRNEAHSISGQLLFNNRNEKTLVLLDCLSVEDSTTHVVGQYEINVAIHDTSKIFDSRIVTALFENQNKISSKINVRVAHSVTNRGTIYKPNYVMNLETISNIEVNKHYKFCKDSSTVRAYVYIDFVLSPKKYIARGGPFGLFTSYKEYTLFFAIVDDHSHDVHSHKTSSINKLSIDSLNYFNSLDELEAYIDQKEHFKEHTEFIKIPICGGIFENFGIIRQESERARSYKGF